MSEWQPIETAPKDGTDIFLWIPDGREIPLPGRWEPLIRSRKVKWILDDGMFLEDRYPLPTHWMPLPDPPKAESDDA